MRIYNNKYITQRDQISVTLRCYFAQSKDQIKKTCSLEVKDLQTCGIQIKANICQYTRYDLLNGNRIVADKIE